MTTIKLKNGSGAPATSDLVQGEPALDLTNKRLYTENASGAIIEIGTSPSTIDINAGTIDGTVIGGASAAALTATTITGTNITANSTITVNNDGGSSFSQSRIILDSNGANRAAGIFSHNQVNDTEWFFGNPYDTPDSFAINRQATASHNDSTSNKTNSLVTVSSAGNVGIGVTSMSSILHTDCGAPSSSDKTLALFQSQSSRQIGFVWDDSASTLGIANFGNQSLAFHVGGNSSEKMRIDSSGNVLVGTSSLGGNSGRFQAVRSNSGAIGYFEVNNGSGVQNAVDITNAANAAFSPLRFWVNGYGTGSLVGSISCTTSATAYNTSSDQRLKENIVDAPAGNIDAIRVRSFDWKADGTHQTYGMVAQELVDVAPEAVTQGETEDDMWAVDYSKLVPMMIKEIQDLKAEVAALKGE